MDALPEVIIVSGDNCSIYNADNGSCMQVLSKNKKFHPKTLTLIGEDYILGALTKPVLKVMAVSKKIGTAGEFTLPGLVTALGATSCGNYCFAGIGKDIYIWKVCTGDLLAIVSAHYQEITCIKCSSEDSHVLTGGKDGHVYVWLLVDLVAVNRASNQKKPRFTWNQHSAEITDIHLTSLGQYARVATVSSDMTCRLYELSYGTLITTVIMDVPLTAVTMDTLECFLFIGDTRGTLHRINIYERLPREMHGNEMKNSEFKIHEAKIVSLHLSLEGNKLVSSSDDRSVRVWDIQSLSCILRIDVEGAITNAFIALRPTPMTDETIKPVFDIVYFKRSLEESKDVRMATVKPGKRTLSAMRPIPPELCYNPSMIYTDAIGQTLNADEATPSAQDRFNAIVNGETVNELTTTNNQIYSTVLKLFFDKIGAENGLNNEEMSQ